MTVFRHTRGEVRVNADCRLREEAVHVADVGLLTAADEAILRYAAANELVIVSA